MEDNQIKLATYMTKRTLKIDAICKFLVFCLLKYIWIIFRAETIIAKPKKIASLSIIYTISNLAPPLTVISWSFYRKTISIAWKSEENISILKTWMIYNSECTDSLSLFALNSFTKLKILRLQEWDETTINWNQQGEVDTKSSNFNFKVISKMCQENCKGKLVICFFESCNKPTHLLQFALGNSAYAIGPKVGVPCLNTAQTTQVFISLLSPLGNKTLISNFFF